LFFLSPSFRDASKRRTRNLEILGTIVSDNLWIPGSTLTRRPGMTEEVDGMTEEAVTMLWDRLGTPANESC